MSSNSTQTTVGLEDVDQDRATVIKQVLTAALRYDHVRSVLARIIDGIPIGETYKSTLILDEDIEKRTEPSQRSMTLSLEFYVSEDRFKELKLNEKVAKLYSLAPSHSQPFKMHLLEIVALAIHDMAANLFASYHPTGRSKLEKDTGSRMTSSATPAYCHSERGPEEGPRKCNSAYIDTVWAPYVFQLSDQQLEHFAAQDDEKMHSIPFTCDPDAK